MATAIPVHRARLALLRESSGGWGIDASFGKRVSTRLTFAYAFNHVPSGDRFRVHFQLVATLL